MYIRWLGAFRKGTNSSVFSSIEFELSRQTPFACERIRKGEKSHILLRSRERDDMHAMQGL